MEDKSDLFLTTSIDVPNTSTAAEYFFQENKQIYPSEFSFNLPKVVCIIPSQPTVENPSVVQFQFPMDSCSCSSTVPFSVPLQFDCCYPIVIIPIQNSMAQTTSFVPENYLFPQQTLQYFFIPQQFNAQYSDFTSLDPNFFDPPNPPLQHSQSNFVNQSIIENSNNTNNNDSPIDESKLEKKRRSNRIAAQKSREKEKNLIVTLKDENVNLKKEYEEKVEEIKRLNFILDRMEKKG
ncbi:hypothetical protein C1645_838274 [Glomus cerebriforme]|uniref:BZIP domain-containing protein n=1 Tax=Glomus cerebriforme TaxID=658196 RepID=A0A397S5B6_9GLOM|nr:hypothetical protein C1645_838274 [Glomus cerebriforme]